jgi:hypothetical protein
MARLSGAVILDPSEILAVHTMARTNRRCFLMGDDQFTGKNFDHRKRWIEDKLKHLATNFGIDLLAFSCLSNHFHLVLRSRPDVVKAWDDTEVARSWWSLCPQRKTKSEIDGEKNWVPVEPTEGTTHRTHRDTACFRGVSCKSVLHFLFSVSTPFFGFIDGVNHGKVV